MMRAGATTVMEVDSAAAHACFDDGYIGDDGEIQMPEGGCIHKCRGGGDNARCDEDGMCSNVLGQACETAADCECDAVGVREDQFEVEDRDAEEFYEVGENWKNELGRRHNEL